MKKLVPPCKKSPEIALKQKASVKGSVNVVLDGLEVQRVIQMAMVVKEGEIGTSLDETLGVISTVASRSQ